MIPTNDGETCVWVAIPPERFRAEARGDLSGAYHRIIAESPHLTELLRGSTCNGGYRGFAGTPGFLRQAFGAGWALVGDAGYFKDPVSAHGITDAFISAELLSDALAAIVTDGDDADEALGAYQRQRDELAALLTPPVAALARLDLDPAGAKAAFRASQPRTASGVRADGRPPCEGPRRRLTSGFRWWHEGRPNPSRSLGRQRLCDRSTLILAARLHLAHRCRSA